MSQYDVDSYIEKLRPYVIELFNKDANCHDISHLERTMKNALYLQKKEGGDRIIVGIAAFLHDIHRIMQYDAGHFVEPKESLGIIRQILSNVDLTQEQVDKICYCIEYHEIYNWNGNNVNDINTLILQDADNLDALGAIGIGRSFSYGATYNRAMYNNQIPIEENVNYTERFVDISTIHHFYYKLFKLASNMNTETARKLAERKTNFMKEFVKEFLDEWNAEY